MFNNFIMYIDFITHTYYIKIVNICGMIYVSNNKQVLSKRYLTTNYPTYSNYIISHTAGRKIENNISRLEFFETCKF